MIYKLKLKDARLRVDEERAFASQKYGDRSSGREVGLGGLDLTRGPTSGAWGLEQLSRASPRLPSEEACSVTRPSLGRARPALLWFNQLLIKMAHAQSRSFACVPHGSLV